MPNPPALAIGRPEPLGAHWDGHGVNMAVYSRRAERIELCLFDESGLLETARLPLPARSGDIWHGYLAGAQPGMLYGLRAYGPYAPGQGHRFNPRKLLIDPYARALSGTVVWNEAILGYAMGDPDNAALPDTRDSAPYVPKCRVVASLPTLSQRPARPRIPWRDTVLYEAHVKGVSMRHPRIPVAVRGTLAALSDPTLIAYWRDLGITTIELLPIAAFVDELPLVHRRLTDYWGYNPIALFAVHGAYLTDSDPLEWVHAIDRLHEAGLEVILDVVFNHTAETDAFGPTLSLRGLDNATYYQLQADSPAHYLDYSGCGNTLDASQSAVIALVHAALRYWACEIGVDGFRFDLASALSRNAHGAFDAQAPLWQAIAGDPDLHDLKLIAEPWDATPQGHALGAFPAPFREWNDRYRDEVRRFWIGDACMHGALATRFAGSSDIFAAYGRPPSAGINFITCHDGFTLADLTAYADKHNIANGWDNRDGASANWSRNFGVEGGTTDTEVLMRRRRIRCSMLGTLLLSRGVPMLLAGDELSRTQLGNNNAYCQDNEISWTDWTAVDDPARDLRGFVRAAIKLRHALRFLTEERFYSGDPAAGCDGDKDITWLHPDGNELDAAHWQDPSLHGLGILVAGIAEDHCEHLFLALNSGDAGLPFRLPSAADPDGWMVVLNSDEATDGIASASIHEAGDTVTVPAGGMLAFVPRRSSTFGVTLELARQAHAIGLSDTYTDASGIHRQVSAASLQALIAAAQATTSLPSFPLIQTSEASCWLPASLASPPGRWVLSVQMYSLRSAQSWGIGDFEDLARLTDILANMGADGIQLSPLHALSLSRPQHASPYAPNSRLMLNPLFISVPQAVGHNTPVEYLSFLDQEETQSELARLRETSLVDYPAVAQLKRRALWVLYQAFRREHLEPVPSAEGAAFTRFCAEEGTPLHHYCVFEALREHVDQRTGNCVSWTAWPASLRHPGSADVADFATQHATEIAFHAYLQWLAYRQWRHAAVRAYASGMQLGFITDLALGAQADSAEAWQWPGLCALDVELGAPPDEFSTRGQCWGLSPWRPHSLSELNYAPFDALLRAAMRHAGAVRLDHAMGLMRQFWVPRGEQATQGAYMAYPFEALLQRVTQASMHFRCAVIGEDLGVVPSGLRERMHEARMLGYRVLYFERDAAGHFLAPDQYAPLSAATLSTHDLPTIQGFGKGLDIDERHERKLYLSPSQEPLARAERRRALRMLSLALAAYGQDENMLPNPIAMHRFLAACASQLSIVQIENVLDMPRQPNLPGMGDEAPNWRQRLPVALEALQSHETLIQIANIFAPRSRAASIHPRSRA